ncbi:MAG: hypothetical protein VX733_15435 [Candidatus Latescibacterota bacterium]|nr:hypothetical protein [Candidatus Latescibacterota bacterium]
MNISISPRAFFSFSFACLHLDEAPRIDGNLKEWDERCRLPNLTGIEGEGDAFADLFMGWRDAGLYFGIEVKSKSRYEIDPRNHWQGDCLELWIDTRDVKDSHTANRYCHQFFFLPGGSGKDGKKPIGRQTSIDRAREQAPPCPEDSIEVGLRRLKRHYQMEIFLPAIGLNGFHPREFDRIGFNYVLHDVEHGTQSWSVGRTPPFVTDPSCWGTAELR